MTISAAMSRRTMILAASAGSAAVAYRTYDRHSEWLAEWIANRDVVDAHPIGEGPEVEKLNARRYYLGDLITETPAQTIDGVRAKLAWLLADADTFWACDQHRELVESVIERLHVWG